MGQSTQILGFIRDATTNQPLAAATVTIKNISTVSSDSSGFFAINSANANPTLIVTIVGYKNQTLTVRQPSDTLIVLMKADNKVLKAVQVKAKRPRYRNKDNPAVELIRKVINNKDRNRPNHYDYVQYEEYEKLQVALSKISSKLTESKLLRKYHFLF